MENKHTDAQTLSALCEQLILMLASGMPLHESIDALSQSRDAAAPLFDALREPLRRGASLSEAMQESGCFPTEMVGMVRAGEEAGRLETVLSGAAAHYARAHRVQTAAGDALRYPLTLMAIITMVIFVLVFQVTPILERALCSLGAGTEGFSESMLLLSRGVSMGVGGLCAAALAGALVLCVLLRGGRRTQLRRKLMLMMPCTARLYRMQSAQRFASLLSVLLRSGVPMERALERLEDVYETPEEKQRMAACCRMMAENESFSAAIESTGLFDPLYIRMIQAGFAAGQCDAALEKTAQMISQDMDDALARLIGKVEPTLMVVMGALIGAVLLSVMAPLAGVLGAIA